MSHVAWDWMGCLEAAKVQNHASQMREYLCTATGCGRNTEWQPPPPQDLTLLEHSGQNTEDTALDGHLDKPLGANMENSVTRESRASAQIQDPAKTSRRSWVKRGAYLTPVLQSSLCKGEGS